MSRFPLGVGILSMLALGFSLAAYVSSMQSGEASTAAMVMFGVVGGSLVGLSGLLLVRAQWARWVLTSTILGTVLLASSSDSLLFWISLALAAMAIVGLWGPWLTLWLRQAPVSDPLGWVPVTLLSSAFWFPLVVAAGSTKDVTGMQWLLVVIVAVSSWAYGRGLRVGAWSFRLLLPLAAAAVLAASPDVGAVSTSVGAIFLTSIAWSAKARMVTAVITPPLRPPVSRKDSEQ